MNSNDQHEIKEIVRKIKETRWENLQGSLETVKHYRHIFLECENGADISLEIEYVKGRSE